MDYDSLTLLTLDMIAKTAESVMTVASIPLWASRTANSWPWYEGADSATITSNLRFRAATWSAKYTCTCKYVCLTTCIVHRPQWPPNCWDRYLNLGPLSQVPEDPHKLVLLVPEKYGPAYRHKCICHHTVMIWSLDTDANIYADAWWCIDMCMFSRMMQLLSD